MWVLYQGGFGIWKCSFFRRKGNQNTWRKTVGAGTTSNNKLNPHTCIAPVRNQTWGTLMEGERCHRYAILAFLRLIPAWSLVGSISSRFGSPVVCPPPNYGWITAPQSLSVTSHPLFMQLTTRGEKWRRLLLCKKLNLLARMYSMWKCF